MTPETGPPYSPAEVAAAGNDWPRRGLLCPHCNTCIPQFTVLGDADHQRIARLCEARDYAQASSALKALTGCPDRWAKIWVTHAGKPTPIFRGPPCPHCGGLLRTPRAKQCPHCFTRWHMQAAESA